LLAAAYLLHWQPCDGPARLAIPARGKNQVFTGNYPKLAQTQLERLPLILKVFAISVAAPVARLGCCYLCHSLAQAFPRVSVVRFLSPFSCTFADVLV